MECKHFYAIKSISCRSLQSSRICRIRRTKRSRTKVTRLYGGSETRGMHDLSSEGKPGAFETCPLDASRLPLKKMKRPTSCSRRVSVLRKARNGGWVRKGKKKKKRRSLSPSSLIATRERGRGEGNGWSGTKVFLFLEDLFLPSPPPWIASRRFHLMSISVYSTSAEGTSACENLAYFSQTLRIIQSAIAENSDCPFSSAQSDITPIYNFFAKLSAKLLISYTSNWKKKHF